MPPLPSETLRARKRVLSKKMDPYRQANGDTGQEGTSQNIEQFPDNVK
jgi:hypothetical protein